MMFLYVNISHIFLLLNKQLLTRFLYVLITNATTKHTLRRQTINQCPWASQDRSLAHHPAPY